MPRSLLLPVVAATIVACAGGTDAGQSSGAASPAGGGAASVRDTTSQPDIVRIAVGSRDHTTLVAALKAAGLVDALANPGPFTVFAPTDAAFKALPAGTLDGLLKPEAKDQLTNVLHHHVTTSALPVDAFSDGQSIGMVDGGSETFSMRNGKPYIGDAQIVASVRGSNGWVHVIDKVLVRAK